MEKHERQTLGGRGPKSHVSCVRLTAQMSTLAVTPLLSFHLLRGYLNFLEFSLFSFLLLFLHSLLGRRKGYVFLFVTPRLLILLIHRPYLINYFACFEIHVFTIFFFSY